MILNCRKTEKSIALCDKCGESFVRKNGGSMYELYGKDWSIKGVTIERGNISDKRRKTLVYLPESVSDVQHVR